MDLRHGFGLRLVRSTSHKALPGLWATNECNIKLFQCLISDTFVGLRWHTHTNKNRVKKY